MEVASKCNYSFIHDVNNSLNCECLRITYCTLFLKRKNLYLLDILYTWNTVLRNYLQTTLYNEFVMSCVKKVLLPIIRGNERLGCCLHKVDYVPLLDLISSHMYSNFAHWKSHVQDFFTSNILLLPLYVSMKT